MTPWYAALTPEQREEIRYEELDLDTQEAIPAPYLDWETVRVGMRVRVVRKCKSDTGGWQNTWHSPAGQRGMDSYIDNDKVYTISRIYKHNAGVEFEEDASYRWPPQALKEARE